MDPMGFGPIHGVRFGGGAEARTPKPPQSTSTQPQITSTQPQIDSENRPKIGQKTSQFISKRPQIESI